MNRFLLFILILSNGVVLAQSKKFMAAIDSAGEEYFDLPADFTKMRLDPFDLDKKGCSGLIIRGVNFRRNQRGRKPLEQDSLLNKFCEAGIETFYKGSFKSHRTWKKEQKGILRALHIKRSQHKLFWAKVFTVDLLDWPEGRAFYFLKNGNTKMRLYEGSQPPTTNPLVDGYVEPKPLEAITEKQLVYRLIEVFPNKGTSRDILCKKYSRIGVSVMVDDYSLNRQRRPRVYVVLMMAGKRTQKVKVERFVEKEFASDKYYE